MKPSVYLETTIISYLAARPSRDLIVAAMQEQTHRWWEDRRDQFELVVAEPVAREVALGDPRAARLRLELLRGVRMIPLTDEIKALTVRIIKEAGLPRRAAIDAAHIASAAVGGAEYLLTWNCAHIANAVFRPRIESVCRAMGIRPPIICTPPELM